MDTEDNKPKEDDLDNIANDKSIDDVVAGLESDDSPSDSQIADNTASYQQDSPSDALSRTPEDLETEKANEETKIEHSDDEVANKKPSKIKKFLKKINVYLMLFILLVVIALIVTTVIYLNSQKDPVLPAIAGQELDEEALKQLANSDASVGSKSQTLTIQGNAVIDGQTLMRGNLNVAGNFQSGGSIQGPTITISGASNLGDTQANTLQIAGNTAIQGGTTLRDLSVSGSSSFSGAMTASQITVTQLILSGNAILEVPNHIAFTGPSPSRTVNSGVLGSGGSATVDGSDTSGTVNINTGNNPSTGCFIRINFRQQYSKQPRTIISPIGYGAGKTEYYVDRDQNGFSICTSSPAPANQSFAFDYFIAG